VNVGPVRAVAEYETVSELDHVTYLEGCGWTDAGSKPTMPCPMLRDSYIFSTYAMMPVRLSVRLSVCDVCALWSQGAMDPGYLCMLG